MESLAILVISIIIIYLVWNQLKLAEQVNLLDSKQVERDVKVFEKITSLEINHNELVENLADFELDYGKLNNSVQMLLDNFIDEDKFEFKLESDRKNFDRLFEFDRDIDKKFDNLQQNKVSLKCYLQDLKELRNEIDKLKLVIESPVFQSYQIFVAELENHKSKIRTTKGRIRLNKELIENMIKDGKLKVKTLYSYADLQTIFMEYLQCKKTSTNSKILRLTEKGYFKRYRNNLGSLYEVNI